MNIQKKLQEAIQLHQSGAYADAEKLYQRVLKTSPMHPDALHLFGLLLMQSGRPKESIPYLDKACKANPSIADYHNSLGEAYRNAGQLAEAQRSYQTALQRNPRHHMVYNNLALTLSQLGDQEGAKAQFQKALSLQPAYADGHFNYATLLQQQGELASAIEHFQEAAKLSPNSAYIWQALGNSQRDLGEYEQAIESYQRSLQLQPNHPNTLNNLGVCLIQQKRFADAVEILQKLLSLHWQLAEAHLNLGNALQYLDRSEQAIEHFQHCLQQQPDNLLALCNLGSAERSLGHIPQSIDYYQRALAIDADYADAHFGLAFSYLLQGDLAKGWPEYEWRWQSSNSGAEERDDQTPRWQGESLKGKRILIYSEQGAGDAIQFARFLPQLAAMGAEVVLQCPASLSELLGNVEGVTSVIDTHEDAPSCNYQLPIMSLPLLLDITLEKIPASPYLHIDPASHNIPLNGAKENTLKVGLCWSGSKLHINNHRRSMPAQYLSCWQMEGIELISLQLADELEGEYLPSAELPLLTPMDRVSNYTDTAQLLSQLDLVITIDTSVAHLAGAMGKPTWLLLPYAPDWRWLLERNDSPWYPALQLFRQPQPGAWDKVAELVKQSLQRAVKDGLESPTVTPSEPPLERSPTPVAEAIHTTGYNQLQQCRHGLFLYNRNDAYVGRSLKNYAEFSEQEITLLDPYLNPGDWVVEVGSNIGSHTVYFAQKVESQGRVIAIEAQRLVFQTLCANIALNSLDNVLAIHAGAGKQNGTIQVPSLSPHQLHNFGGVSIGKEEGETTRLLTIDSLELAQCKLLKADVEGMEKQVLEGAKKTIRRCRPLLYLENDRKERSAELVEYIKALGYRLYWHLPPLYSPDNFAANPENLFGDIVSINLLGVPEESDLQPDLEPVISPYRPWEG